MNLKVYSDVKPWKKPIHVTKTAIAQKYQGLLSRVQTIGVAGSVGKTLTQNAIYSVLVQKYNVSIGDENLDPTFRIPKTILKTKPWHNYQILEYGVEHPGEMDHYLAIAKPNIAVMTILSPEHTKYFGDMAGVIAEESKIISAVPNDGYVLLNADDKNAKKLTNLTKSKIIWFGKKARNGVKISHFKQNMHGSKFRIHYGGQVASVHTKFVGSHQLTSAYIAATVGIICQMTLKQIAKGLSQIKVPEHRLTPKKTDHANIIDDTYNSSPQAAIESIKTLQDLGHGKKKIAVLGEMKDLGELSIDSHKQLGEKIAKSRINYLITVGKTAQIIAKAAKKAKFRGKIIDVANTKAALKVTKPLVSKKSIVLVKGSRHAHMERIVFGLMHKSTVIECYHCGKLK